MAEPDVIGRAQVPVATPYAYELGPLERLLPRTIFAHFDGTSAGGSYVPCVSYYSQDGTRIMRAVAPQALAAGASADVSWFPNGVVANSTPATQAFVQLYDNVLSAPAANFDIQNINQNYNHLELLTYLRDAGAAGSTSAAKLTCNGDNTLAYETSNMQGNTSATAASGFQGNWIQNHIATGNGGDPGHYGSTRYTLHDYSRSLTDHTFSGTGFVVGTGVVTTFVVLAVGGQYCKASPTAINRLTLTPLSGGNFATGSRATLYGLL